MSAAPLPPPASFPASLASFHERAEKGEPLKVVFLGGSLTWGANSSDPQTTSYRGLMMQYLCQKYPKSSFTFRDAAIGGTGSLLGIFRLQRDVLSQKPDLVFLDFTVNDGSDKADEQSLASYEYILRKLFASGSAVLPVLMCFKQHVENPDAPVPPRHLAHLKLAKAYKCPVANVLQAMREAMKSAAIDPAKIWCIGTDRAHPDDSGYRLYFEAVRNAFELATRDGSNPQIPETSVFPNLYPRVERMVLVNMPLPAGWQRLKTYRTSLWFDGLSSRWLSDVAGARKTPNQTVAPLEVRFHGSLVGLMGERNSVTPPFRVWIDGKPIAQPKPRSEDPNIWSIDTSSITPTKPGNGNLFAWTLLSDELTDGEHVLKIEPLFERADPDAELRIESVCSAGR